jgi:hypothetical protein
MLLALERDLEDFTPVWLFVPYAGVRAGCSLYYKPSLLSIENKQYLSLCLQDSLLNLKTDLNKAPNCLSARRR